MAVSVQLSFQRGMALATACVSTLLTNLLPVAADVTIFGGHLPGGGPGRAVRSRLRRGGARTALALVAATAAASFYPERADVTVTGAGSKVQAG